MCQWVSVPSSIAAPVLIVQSSYSDNKSLYFCNPSLKYWIFKCLRDIYKCHSSKTKQKKNHKKTPTQVNLSLSDSFEKEGVFYHPP